MTYVIGIDEAGRGPLAGPVAVGLISVSEDFDLLGTFPKLNDSKKLTEKRREVLFELLQEQVVVGLVRYSVQLRSAREIDRRGISVVIRESIETGLKELASDGEGKVWLDGSLHAPSIYEQETVIGGDAKVPAIMLASIAAKVTRDRHMHELHKTYPVYGFDRHKGYGTKAHMDAIRTHGLSDIHRTTYVHLD
jgi:ribonuclease HII